MLTWPFFCHLSNTAKNRYVIFKVRSAVVCYVDLANTLDGYFYLFMYILCFMYSVYICFRKMFDLMSFLRHSAVLGVQD